MGDEVRVVMPQLGESIVEATLVRWRVKPGDSVARGQILAEVETEKATNELPSPAAGVVGALAVGEGATVPVGTTLTAIRASTGAAATVAQEPPPLAAKSNGQGTRATPARERLPSRHLAPRPAGAFASPAVRRIAREHALDLNGLEGTGRGGRLTRSDVLQHLDRARTAAPQPAPAARSGQGASGVYRQPEYALEPGDAVVPFTRKRAYVAEHLVHSIATAAHVAAVAEIDMTAVGRARKADQAQAGEVKLSATAYVVEAVARALAAHPTLNATVKGSALVLRAARNIGVAVDTPEGLVVPVIRRADELTVVGIARAIEALSEKARSGKLAADDVSGGSFTISNPGRDGNLFGISIIRQPEVAIFRMGEIVKRPVVREVDGGDAIVIRPIMYAALSYDHRVIDGRAGNAFLHEVRERLETVRPLSELGRP